MEQSALTPEEVRKDILLYLFSLHWLAQGAARLPGRWARLWFYFAGCRSSRKAVGIGKCLFKKKSKCCQRFCLQSFILCEAAISRSHCLQNGAGERYWELPLPAQFQEPLCCSEREEKPVNSWPPPPFTPWEADTSVLAVFADWDPAMWQISGALPFHGPLPFSPVLWSLVFPHASSRAGSEPQCHSPAFTLRGSCKDWKCRQSLFCTSGFVTFALLIPSWPPDKSTISIQ